MTFIPLTPYRIEAGSVICPICSSAVHTDISDWDRRFKRLKHVKCEACSLIRHMPLPSKAALAKYYAEDYRSDYQQVSADPTEKHRKKRLIEGEKRLAKLMPFLPSIQSIFDFGCGSGEFIELCNEKGLVTKGFEPGKGYAEYARTKRNLNVLTGDLNSKTLENQFDLITSFHVFEHLIDPLDTLKSMTSWLKPNGKILLETPDMTNALYKGFGCLHFAHTLGFTAYSLEYLGAQAGLKIVQTFEDYDIGVLFEVGTPRALEDISKDASNALAQWSKSKVHKQFWKYRLSNLIGQNILPGKDA